MKLIIDIDEKLYKDIQTIGIPIGKIDYVLKAIKSGIPLKDEVMIATLMSLVTDKDYKPKSEGEQE